MADPKTNDVDLPGELRMLYEKHCNGAFLFEGSLIIRPLTDEFGLHDLIQWNNHDLWRRDYFSTIEKDGIFFAEDLFGYQYSYLNYRVAQFDPETGEVKDIARDLDDWAEIVMANLALWTGYPLYKTWQIKNGPLPPGVRLMPKIPFICGGEFKSDNMLAKNEVESMRIRSSWALQLRNVPDKTKIRFTVVD